MICEAEFNAWKAAEKKFNDLGETLLSDAIPWDALIQELRDQIAQIDRIIAAGLSVGVSAASQSIKDYEAKRQKLLGNVQKARDSKVKIREEYDKANQAVTDTRRIYEECFAKTIAAATSGTAGSSGVSGTTGSSGTSGAVGTTTANTASSGASGQSENEDINLRPGLQSGTPV